MLPTAISLKNFRSFASWQRLELRPVTLLYGINNSGKSALLRSLPLLSSSVDPDSSGPLDLKHPAVRGSSFRDLLWKGLGKDEASDLSFAFHWSDGEPHVCAQFDLRWFEEWKRLIVAGFSFETAGKKIQADWIPRRSERSERGLSYQIQVNGWEGESAIRFDGLVPSAEEGLAIEGWDLATDRLREFRGQTLWLGATRKVPTQRIVPLPTAPKHTLEEDGRDAPEILFSDERVLAEVSGWYERHLKRRLHPREVPPDGFRLMLQNLEKAELDVDLVDTGEGMIQVLPVLVALALGRVRSEDSPKILAIEEPESNLHPSLQRALTEHICSVAAEPDSAHVVLETHSEHVLLGIQLEVLRGRLRPEDVLVYWVRQLDTGESVAEPVRLDAAARLQGHWPPDVFSDDTDLAREVIRARRELASP